MPFAQSMLLPPPNPTITLTASFFARAKPRSTSSVVGFWRTSSNTAIDNPADFSAWSARSSCPASRSPRSVTRSTRVPNSAVSSPSCPSVPDPNTTRVRGSKSNAGSPPTGGGGSGRAREWPRDVDEFPCIRSLFGHGGLIGWVQKTVGTPRNIAGCQLGHLKAGYQIIFLKYLTDSPKERQTLVKTWPDAGSIKGERGGGGGVSPSVTHDRPSSPCLQENGISDETRIETIRRTGGPSAPPLASFDSPISMLPAGSAASGSGRDDNEGRIRNGEGASIRKSATIAERW